MKYLKIFFSIIGFLTLYVGLLVGTGYATTLVSDAHAPAVIAVGLMLTFATMVTTGIFFIDRQFKKDGLG